MSQLLHTVAVYQKGTRLRVLVDGLECPADEAPQVALQTVIDLGFVPHQELAARVIRTDLVTDVAHQDTTPPTLQP